VNNLKRKIRKENGRFVAYIGNICIGRSNRREGACHLIRSAERAIFIAERGGVIQRRIRRARQLCFERPNATRNLDRLKAELECILRRDLGWDTARLITALSKNQPHTRQ
jgi:hypothetical protein